MVEAKPKVSVVMITYNHEKFIEQAVNSVLMQETNFDYEIIIGEDCSTDRTREILLELQKQHPDKIRLVLNPQNLGMIPNFVNVLSMARGEYVALLEGDDYWTHPKKLQIQVDYMEAHPECRICFHAAHVILDNKPERIDIVIKPHNNKIINLEGWLKYRSKYKTFIPTGAVLFRAVSKPLPKWYRELRAAGDWPLFLWLLLQGGELVFVEGLDGASVYRNHAGGVTKRTSNMDIFDRIEARLIDLQDHLLVSAHIDRRLQGCLSPRLSNIHLDLANDFLACADYGSARRHLFCSLYYSPVFSQLLHKRFFRVAIRCYFPGLYAGYISLRSWLKGMYKLLRASTRTNQ